MLNQQWGLIVWTLITFGISIFVLWRYAFGPIQQIIDRRRQIIRESIETAEASREEATKLLEDYKETLARVRGEADEILERSRRAGEQISLWRTMTGRGLNPFDEERAGSQSGGNLPVVAAVALALFLLTSLLVYGPRLWHLPLVIGVGLLLVRRRI